MTEALKAKFAVPSVSVSTIGNGIPVVEVKNALAEAKISLLGAHVLSFTPKGAEDILWVSGKSNFTEGKPIRGGIPVCWPWFGPAGTPAHGIARIRSWEPGKATEEADGSTTLELSLDTRTELGLTASMKIHIGTALTVELKTVNCSDKEFTLSEALHTYFSVGDIEKVTVCGFDGSEYLNTVNGERLVQHGDLVFQAETDRIFDSFSGTAVIHDPVKKRSIKVEKSGSNSSVVWNPWIEKSIRMADFGDEEYHTMLCVEAANAKNDTRILAPRQSHTLMTRVSLIF